MFKNITRFRIPFLILILCAIVMIGGRALKAQGTTATILGTVSDTSGAVIPNATVKVTDVDTGVAITAMSDAQGRYVAPTLPIGNYSVEVSAPGFETTTHSGITLSLGSQSVVDFSMRVGQTQQTVTVEGQVSQVETTSTTISSLVDQTQMRALPLNGRNVEQLILLAPGVQQMTSFGKSSFFGEDNEYSFSGARPSDQALLLDGQDVQNYWGHGMGAASIGTSLGIDSIAEFRTLTSTYSAQYGGNGSVMSQVTKSGTNSFHGSGYDFLRNSALDASNYFQQTGVPPFRKNQFGGSIGGPIKKDKVFFFTNYEAIRQLLSETETDNVPDANAHNGYLPCAAAGVSASSPSCVGGLDNVGVASNVAATMAIFPLPTKELGNGIGSLVVNANQITSENYILGRVDWNVSSKDSFFTRYLRDSAVLDEPFAGSNLSDWPAVFTTPNQYFTVQERHIFSPTLINSARVSVTRTSNGQNALNGINAPGTPALMDFPDRPDDIVSIASINTIGPYNEYGFRDFQNKFEEGDDVIWTRGAHTISIGVDIERTQTNINGQNYRWSGIWTFTSLDNFMLGNAYSLVGILPGEVQPIGSAQRETQYSPYIQDDWKATRKLTVNAGLRYDFESNPTSGGKTYPIYEFANPPYTPPGCTAANPISCDAAENAIFTHGNPAVWNFDPRVGLAYDPFSDHKTSIRAGFGLFHDPIESHQFYGGSGTNPYTPGSGQAANPIYPIPFASVAPPGLLVSNPGSDPAIDVTPYTLQWDLSVQRELPSSWLLSATFVGSRGNYLLNELDLNPVIPTTDANGVQHFGTLVQTTNPLTGAVTGSIVPNPRVNPAIGLQYDTTAHGWSTYDGLQVGLTHRFAANFTAQLSYTYSHCLDDGSAYISTEVSNNGGNQDPYNQALDKGQCGFDVRNAMRLNWLYNLPFKGNMLVQGWQLSGIITATSGIPISIGDGFDYVGDQLNSRPNRVPCSQLIIGSVNQWFNPACFALQAPGTLGDAGRTNVPGPAFSDVDFSIIKDTRITKISEAFDVQFRAECFNLFNHPDFSLPSSSLYTETAAGLAAPSPTAGQITSTASTSRQIQFGLKVIF